MKTKLQTILFLITTFFLCSTGIASAADAINNNEIPVALRPLAHEAQDDDAGAQLLYGLAYLEGRDGLQLDAKKAAYWLRRSARIGNAYAQLVLGKMFAEGNGVEKDFSHAVKWWQESAKKDNDKAQFLLGKALLEGQGIKKNIDNAIQWLEKSADQNNKEAQFLLGKLYIEGYAIPKDETIAKDWLTQAAELGHGGAIKLLTLLKESVDFTLKVYQESSSELQKRAENGDSQAQYELGIRYESGAWDVIQDNAQALKWITKAAEDGNLVAMDTLADIYRHGDLALAVDTKKAQIWDAKAASVRTKSSQ